MIDLSPQDLTTVKRILARYVPECEVRAFGSRVSWTAKPHSDLDLVVVGKEKLLRSILSALITEFEDSAIPVTVDLMDWHRISPEFRKNIDKEYEVIQTYKEIEDIPEGWRFRKIYEIADVIGGGTPKTKKPEYWGGDISWLTPKDLSGEHERYVSSGARNITKKGLENSSARILPPNTVLLSSRAPVGYLALAKNQITTNQGFRNLVVKEGYDPEFVYYLLLNNTDYLKQHASGSTFQELSGSTLKSLDFLFPPLREQRAIAHILGILDDKIELNRRMNETLESITLAIFKSWFVDFDPVRAKAEGRDPGLPDEIAALFPDSFEDSELGEIPKGWKAKPFGELLEKTIGGDWGKVHEDAKHTLKSVIIRGADIPELKAGSLGKTPTRWVEEKKLKTRLLVDGDIVIEISGGSPKQPTGRSLFVTDSLLARLDNTVEPSSFCRLLRPINNKLGLLAALHLTYIYSKGKMWEYQNQSTGISNFQTKTFLRMELVAVPDDESILSVFYVTCRPQVDASQSNECVYLASLRNTLLAKLISGELRVPDTEKLLDGLNINGGQHG